MKTINPMPTHQRLVKIFLVCTLVMISLTCLKYRESSRVFNVLDYGAVGDGLTLDSPAIQKAIDAAASKGEGTRVLLPGKHSYLCGTIELKSNIDFHIAQDAEILLSTVQEDFIQAALITADEAENLMISGTGNIDGRVLEFMSHYDSVEEWWRPKGWRPTIFLLTSCKNLIIKDISFGDAPYWGLHMLGCDEVLVDNIKIRNNLEVPNCDGIDPDHCRNVEIKNCHLICGDDPIAIKSTPLEKDYGTSYNITVRDCILETQDSVLKIGTQTAQDIHDVLFERCEIITSCRGLTIQLRDEGDVYNVVFRDINFVSRYYSEPWWGRGEAISLTTIPRTPEISAGSIHDIKFINVTGRAENSVRLNGTPESRVRNVNFNNVHITFDRWTSYTGGVYDNRPTTAYQEIESHPTPGFSIRYADSIVFENISISWGQNIPEYFTYAGEAVNVSSVDFGGLSGTAAHPERDEAINIR